MDNEKFNSDTNEESVSINNNEDATTSENTTSNEETVREEQSIIDVSYDEVTPAPIQAHTYYHETIKEPQQTKEPKKKAKGKGMLKFLTGVVVASMVGGSFAGAGFALAFPYANELYEQNTGKSIGESGGDTAQVDSGSTQTNYAQPTNYTGNNQGFYNPVPVIAENIGPSVVSIINTKVINTWGGEYSESGLGSGVIFQVDDEKVYIVSNAHVVADASSLVVTFLGNYKVPAQIVGYDTDTDIAVVSVLQEDIPQDIRGQIKPAPIGDSNNLQVGDMAIAIGTPIDEAYNNTVTVGYISALDREINLTDQTFSLIQTDAAINPGNSGGALVGPSGEVIGINTIKLVDDHIEGMGFAIPINDVKPIVEELMTHGRIIKPSLGIVGTNLESTPHPLFQTPVGIGVIEVMPGSSAALAGIQPKDIINVKTDNPDAPIKTVEDLQAFLKEKEVGDTIGVIVVRGSEMFEITVELRELPQ